jgi:hypothetical protein
MPATIPTTSAMVEDALLGACEVLMFAKSG